MAHAVVFVHRGHAVVSPILSMEHAEPILTSACTVPAKTVQQPKQSHPFGVYCRQKSIQAFSKSTWNGTRLLVRGGASAKL